MRITRTRVCLAGLVCAVGLAFVPLKAAEEGRAKEETLAIVYPVADLTVRSVACEHGDHSTFDPSLLLTVIKATIAPESWQDGSGQIAIHEKTCSFIVRQTKENHDQLAELLSKLRRTQERELEKPLSRVDTSKDRDELRDHLVEKDVQDRKHSIQQELHKVFVPPTVKY
ncbi:MAG: hypothetical protein KDA93_24835 [Planctomycetaceae bacterium]|nr:hypothetical protein [Planctomycetaceae bacterium]